MHTTLRIEINGHRHEVRHHIIPGREIKTIGDHEHGLLFRVTDEGRQPIGDDEEVHLRDGERFEIIPAPVHLGYVIEVDGKLFKTEHHRRTGAEIKALAKRPPGNTLYRLQGQQRVRVGDDEVVELHELERFVTSPPHGHAG